MRIVAITRLQTQNAGNAALSASLLEFLSQKAPSSEVRALDRYPRRFESLHRRRRLSQADAVARFEQTARRLLRWAGPVADQPLAPVADPSLIRLDNTARELPKGVRDLKRRLGVRRNLARFGLIGQRDFRTSINSLAWSDLVVWNPAGEYHPTGDPDQPYRLLLMVRIAQLLGKRTAVVNHSLELDDPALTAIVRWVYSRADFISVRDSPSMDVLRRLDLDSVQVTESPDLVFLTGEGSRRPAGPDAPICLSINGLQALAGCDEWRALMDGLVALGRPLRFVSNAMNHDREFARGLAETWPVEVIDCQPTPAELEAIFGECAVLISSRLHASIMALGAGTPVVSIEPQVFKLTAIFEQMRYPIGTENIKASGWSARTLAKVGRALAERDALAREGVEAIERQVARIDAAYAPMFALAPRAQTAE